MNDFKQAFSQIRAECESAAFLTNVRVVHGLLFGRPLVLYGAANLGIRTAKWLIRNEIPIDAFCDSVKRGMQPDTSLPIISPEELQRYHKNANIVVCSIAHASAICERLHMLGIPDDQIYAVEDLHMQEMFLDAFLPHLDGYEWAYHFFSDQISKNIILERISGYLLTTPMHHSLGVEYFDDSLLHLGNSEVFVDGGVFTGDTAAEFIQCVGGNFKHYYGFEIDVENYRQASENLKNIDRVTLIQKGLWLDERKLKFAADMGESSKLSDAGTQTVEVTSIDAFFSKVEDKPTLIKLDIEGVEKEALLGARRTITNLHPQLAVCVYHKPEDIYTLTQQLYKYYPGYRFFLRHYSNTLLDTVLYAVRPV